MMNQGEVNHFPLNPMSLQGALLLSQNQ